MRAWVATFGAGLAVLLCVLGPVHLASLASAGILAALGAVL